MQKINTINLELICSDYELVNLEIHSFAEFLSKLGAEPMDASNWPPPLNDHNSQEYILNYNRVNPNHHGWTQWYMLLKNVSSRTKNLIGNGGFKGQPENGVVEIGYSIIEKFQGRGFGTEYVRALSEWAFKQPENIQAIKAQTLPELTASIRVLEKNGFEYIDSSDDEPDVISYLLKR